MQNIKRLFTATTRGATRDYNERRRDGKENLLKTEVKEEENC